MLCGCLLSGSDVVCEFFFFSFLFAKWRWIHPAHKHTPEATIEQRVVNVFIVIGSLIDEMNDHKIGWFIIMDLAGLMNGILEDFKAGGIRIFVYSGTKTTRQTSN